MGPPVLRSVVLETRAAEAVDELTASVDRFDEIHQAFEWLLAQNPDVGARYRDFRVYVVGADKVARTPEIWLAYRYADKEISIRAIKAVSGEQPID